MKTLILLLTFIISFKTYAVEKIKFIVNENNPATQITVSQIRDFYFKKVRSWPSGTPLRFFDRQDNSKEKSIFNKDYVRKNTRQLEQHWIGQKLYSGESAPTKVGSDFMVASLVSRFPGGISYVSEDFATIKGTKVIEVIVD